MSPSFWHWWILAGALLVLEAFTPGFVFLWLGVSAALTGLALLVLPWLPWQWQVLAFALFAVASVAGWLAWRRGREPPSADGGLNRRAEALVGRTAILETALSAGRHGRVRLGDTTWAASGPDALPAGARVRIVGARGTVLLVESAASDEG